MMTYLNDFSPEDFLFIPLGGSEQFGLNLNVYGYGGKWLAVDCGIGFADERHPGVDVLIPDPTFLEERRDDLLGIFVTHAHEDHVGAIPYLWSRLKCPIYCTPFTASFLRRKASEFGDTKGMVIHEIHPDQILQMGPFKVGVIGVTHSTPSTVSFTIETAKGLVVHGNEWNLDPCPRIGGVLNREAFKGAGRKGVLAYVGDSTNAPFTNVSVGEEEVEKGLIHIFEQAPKKIVTTLFSSNIARVITIARAAQACGRHVCLAGRSLFTYTDIAREHQMMRDMPPFLNPKEAARVPDNKICYIVTGGQGESRAAMARIARGEYRDVKVGAGDMAVFSARIIPNHERHINHVKNNLIRAGVRIIDVHYPHARVHVSGHTYRNEIAEMLDWVKPKILIPIQGERMHIEAQASLGREKNIPFVIPPENGDVILLDPDKAAVMGRVPARALAVEPSRVMALDHQAIQERRQLNETGALHITVVMDKTGRLAAPVRLSGLGLFDEEDPEDSRLIKDVAEELSAWIDGAALMDRGTDEAYLSGEIGVGARRMISAALGFKPKTTVHVVKI